MSNDPDRRDERHLSADRETIRGWAEEHDATPVRNREDPDRYRVVPESTVEESHERVDWDNFVDYLQEGDYVVVYHGAEETEPFEVTHRDEAVTRFGGDREDLEERLIEGETVTSQVTETTVVETVVVEEATIESELVDTEVIDQQVVDVELLRRECMNCDLVDEGILEDRDWFDEERYFGAVGRAGAGGVGTGTTTTGIEGETTGAETERTTGTPEADTEAERAVAESTALESTEDFPYYAQFDVEEAWSVTREFTERFTVESRVEDTEVAETDTVENRDIDVEGLQRTIAESDLLDINLSPEDVLTECEIESEFDEDDRIHTHFTRERVVEDEVVDRMRLRADVTGGEIEGMETISTRDIAAEVTDEMGEMSETTAGETVEGTEQVTFSDDEIGKTVTDATGDEVGIVSDVTDDGQMIYVDADPSVTERIKAALDWGDAKEDDYPVGPEEVERITRDEVRLKETEEIESSGSPR